MASSRQAKFISGTRHSDDNMNAWRKYLDDFARMEARYKDRGSSGKAQMQEELESLEKEFASKRSKRADKATEDRANISLYGKDAMKGRGFAQYNKGGKVKKMAKGGGKVRGYKDGGGVCRGGGAAVSGTKFRGVK